MAYLAHLGVELPQSVHTSLPGKRSNSSDTFPTTLESPFADAAAMETEVGLGMLLLYSAWEMAFPSTSVQTPIAMATTPQQSRTRTHTQGGCGFTLRALCLK